MFDRLFLFLVVVYCPRGGLCGSRAVAGRQLEGEHFEGDIAMRERLPGGSHGARLAALRDSSKRWPGGRVAYRIDTNSIPNAEHHQIIRDAMDQISRKVTCVQFEDNDKLDNPKLDFIRIAADGDAKNSALGCWSYLGMIGGEQTLNLDGNCFREDLIIHELLHALSFIHEQNRSDRDNFVEIQLDNIKPGMESQFIKRNESEVDAQNTPYDFRSRLHYPPKAFSKSGEDTIVALYPGNDNFGPVDTGLSPIDIVEISLLYDCPVKNSDIIEYIHQNRLANEMRIEILDENNYEEFSDIKARMNGTEEELDSMKLELAKCSSKLLENSEIDAIKTQLEEMKLKNNEDVNNLKLQHSSDIASIKLQHGEDINNVKRQNTEDNNKIKEKQTQDINNMKEKHTEDINNMKEKHTEDINNIKEKHREDINSMKEKHREDNDNIKEQFSDDLNKMKSQILSDIATKSPKPVGGYFGACVNTWCRHLGTLDQFTRCESVRDEGLTCIHPEVKYGATEGGIPSKGGSSNYNDWCHQLLGTEKNTMVNTAVRYGARDCAAPRGRLVWGTGGDEPAAKWKDSQDEIWRDGSLDAHAGCETEGIISVSCKNEEYFGACVDSWCRQSGPSDQFTKCESVRDGGLTCVNPEVRYGSTEGGIPSKWSGDNDYDAWCQQLLGFGTNSRVTYGARDCAAPKGRVWWYTGYDEPGVKWCEYGGDGKWKDGSLVTHSGCDTKGITSLTCSK